jgi:hypothetical protein
MNLALRRLRARAISAVPAVAQEDALDSSLGRKGHPAEQQELPDWSTIKINKIRSVLLTSGAPFAGDRKI